MRETNKKNGTRCGMAKRVNGVGRMRSVSVDNQFSFVAFVAFEAKTLILPKIYICVAKVLYTIILVYENHTQTDGESECNQNARHGNALV